MAQWQELLQMDSALQSQVSQLYVGRFPREIRHHLSVWIESQDWRSAAADENMARVYFQALLLNLEEQRTQCIHTNSVLLGPDYSAMTDYLSKHFEDQPLTMANILSECLNEEKRILTSSSEGQQMNSSGTPDQNQRDLDNRVKGLREQTWEAEQEIKSLEALNEQLEFIQKSWETQVEQLDGRSHELVQQECVRQANFITQTKQMVLGKIVNILNLAGQIVQTLTVVELPEWKRRQQLACIGSPSNTCLDHLQTWFTTVAEILQQICQQLKKLKEQNDKYNIDQNSNLADIVAQIDTFAVSLLKQLFENALVVEKQPVLSSLTQRPLVLKTGVRFSVTVRFLANLPEFKCHLKVKPVFDKDVEEVKTIKGFRQFVFSKDDSKVLDVFTPGGGLTAEFGHMSLKESKPRSKGSESPLLVTEELHIIKFLTDCRCAGLDCQIETSSLPVVVVSATNQVSSAWASIMWFNMLSTSEPRNLSLFVDPPPLLWQQLSQVLSWQFVSAGDRELSEDQLSMLRDKIVDDPDGLVYWNKFSKNEGMWTWIDGILDLIKRHLKDFWKNGFIMGFVSKATTQLLLKKKQAGNFVIRFSESYREGAVTFSWVEHVNGEATVHAVEPYTKKELSAESLPDIIDHFSRRKTTTNPLLYLYPDIPRDSAFGCYYTTSGMSPKNKDGYWHRKRVNVIDCPTPPPSPPPIEADMDIELDPSQVKQSLEDIIPELFSGLQDYPGSHLSCRTEPLTLSQYLDSSCSNI